MMPNPVDKMGVHQKLSSNSLNSGNCAEDRLPVECSEENNSKISCVLI